MIYKNKIDFIHNQKSFKKKLFIFIEIIYIRCHQVLLFGIIKELMMTQYTHGNNIFYAAIKMKNEKSFVTLVSL